MNKKERFLILASPHEGYAHRPFENLFSDTLIATDEILKLVTRDDVVLFDGGTDVSPSLYFETRSPFSQFPDSERDARERKVFIKAQSAGAACIGVCRGAQFLNVVSGGRLIQHVTNHGTNHFVKTIDGEQIQVTSTHHQQMWPFLTNHEMVAWADHHAESFCEYGKDFYITRQPEIVWFPQTRSLCIQGHPEYLKPEARFYRYSRELVVQHIFKEKA